MIHFTDYPDRRMPSLHTQISSTQPYSTSYPVCPVMDEYHQRLKSTAHGRDSYKRNERSAISPFTPLLDDVCVISLPMHESGY